MKKSSQKRQGRKKGRRQVRGGFKKGSEGMDLKDLRFFVAVYEAKGFSRACDTLGTVQSNVSSRIIELERSLGEPLFERRWRRLVPTAKGEKFYNYAKHFVASLDHAERTLRA
jgi:DNA-binding transcriptional LysR family regulator